MSIKLKNKLKKVEQQAELNLVRAINKGMQKGKTTLVRLVRSEINIKYADVASRINIKQKANRKNMQGVIRGNHHSNSLINFGAKAVKGGVKVKVAKGSTGSVIPRACITGRGNSRRVVIRRSNKKLKTLKSASVDQVLRTNYPRVLGEIETFVEDEFKRLMRVKF